MLDAGMDDFVGKPYSPGEIYACLTKQLDINFQYKGVVEPQKQARRLTPEMLSVLPITLREELYEALVSLDNDRIDQIVRQVAAYDQELEQTLVQFTECFDYPAILQALSAI